MAQAEFVELRVSNGAVRFSGTYFRPRIDANYLNGEWLAFGLYYNTETVKIGDQEVQTNKLDTTMIQLWGTPDMLRIMRSKGWPSQWSTRDLELLRNNGRRLPLLFWRSEMEKSPERG